MAEITMKEKAKLNIQDTTNIEPNTTVLSPERCALCVSIRNQRPHMIKTQVLMRIIQKYGLFSDNKLNKTMTKIEKMQGKKKQQTEQTRVRVVKGLAGDTFKPDW